MKITQVQYIMFLHVSIMLRLYEKEESSIRFAMSKTNK